MNRETSFLKPDEIVENIVRNQLENLDKLVDDIMDCLFV